MWVRSTKSRREAWPVKTPHSRLHPFAATFNQPPPPPSLICLLPLIIPIQPSKSTLQNSHQFGRRQSLKGRPRRGPKLNIPSATSSSEPDQLPLTRTSVLSQEGHHGPLLEISPACKAHSCPAQMPASMGSLCHFCQSPSNSLHITQL